MKTSYRRDVRHFQHMCVYMSVVTFSYLRAIYIYFSSPGPRGRWTPARTLRLLEKSFLHLLVLCFSRVRLRVEEQIFRWTLTSNLVQWASIRIPASCIVVVSGVMEARVSAVRPSPLRRPQEREEYRKSLYKSSPTSWRATYAEVQCRLTW